MSTDTPTITSRKGLETKKHILENALKLFSEKGFKATTVRDIANGVGIKPSALYNHFKSKDDIFEALILQLTSSAIVNIFKNDDIEELHKKGRILLLHIANTFKLISFDKKNSQLYKLLMQEIYNNESIRAIYSEHFYQENVKRLSGILFAMMQDNIIKSSDPLLLANEFLSPLFFYNMQISLLKEDNKSTSSLISMFDKHVDFFWNHIKIVQTELF